MGHGNQGTPDRQGKGEGDKTANYEMTPKKRSAKRRETKVLVHTAQSAQNMAIPGKTIRRLLNFKPEHTPNFAPHIWLAFPDGHMTEASKTIHRFHFPPDWPPFHSRWFWESWVKYCLSLRIAFAFSFKVEICFYSSSSAWTLRNTLPGRDFIHNWQEQKLNNYFPNAPLSPF